MLKVFYHKYLTCCDGSSFTLQKVFFFCDTFGCITNSFVTKNPICCSVNRLTSHFLHNKAEEIAGEARRRRKGYRGKPKRENLWDSGSSNEVLGILRVWNGRVKEEGRKNHFYKLPDALILVRGACGGVNCLMATPDTERRPTAIQKPLQRPKPMQPREPRTSRSARSSRRRRLDFQLLFEIRGVAKIQKWRHHNSPFENIFE